MGIGRPTADRPAALSLRDIHLSALDDRSGELLHACGDIPTGQFRHTLHRGADARRAIADVVGVAGDQVGEAGVDERLGGAAVEVGLAVEQRGGVDLHRHTERDDLGDRGRALVDERVALGMREDRPRPDGA